MKAEEVVLIAAVGASAGAVSRKLGLTTGNSAFDAVIGLAIAGIGWFMDYDGAGDFIEGYGVGYFFDSVL